MPLFSALLLPPLPFRSGASRGSFFLFFFSFSFCTTAYCGSHTHRLLWAQEEEEEEEIALSPSFQSVASIFRRLFLSALGSRDISKLLFFLVGESLASITVGSSVCLPRTHFDCATGIHCWHSLEGGEEEGGMTLSVAVRGSYRRRGGGENFSFLFLFLHVR